VLFSIKPAAAQSGKQPLKVKIFWSPNYGSYAIFFDAGYKITQI
jgi:hypothetical protein